MWLAKCVAWDKVWLGPQMLKYKLQATTKGSNDKNNNISLLPKGNSYQYPYNYRKKSHFNTILYLLRPGLVISFQDNLTDIWPGDLKLGQDVNGGHSWCPGENWVITQYGLVMALIFAQKISKFILASKFRSKITRPKSNR